MLKGRKAIEKFMSFIMKRSTYVIIALLAITCFFAYSMKDLNLDTNVFGFTSDVPPAPVITTPEEKPNYALKLKGLDSTFLVPDRGEVVDVPERVNTFSEEEFKNTTEFIEIAPILETSNNPSGGFGDGYVIIFTSDRMFDPEVLNTIESVMHNLEQRPEIGECLSPFDYVTVEKKGTRLSIVPISPVKEGETWTDESAKIFHDRLMNDSVAKNYLYTADGSTIMIYYRARGLNTQSIQELNTIVNPLRQYGRVALNGGGLITDAVTGYINRDLILLIVLCFIVILVVFYLSFRSIRAVIIPCIIDGVGLIWTLGTMALAGIDLTIVTILTPCLVLTLGSSYSIHMISEYFEAWSKNDQDKLNVHYSRIAKTIFFAMLTTVAGFLALLICRTSIFKEFGITISFGVTYCWFLSFTLLPALLTKTKAPKNKQIKAIEGGLMTKIVHYIAKIVTKFWYIFVIIFVVMTVLFFFIRDDVGFDSNYMNYFPSDDPIAIDSKYFAKTLGGTDPYFITINAPAGTEKFFLQSENLKLVYAYEAAIQAACPDIVQILSFSQYVSFLNEVYNGEAGIPDNNGLILLLSRTLSQISKQIGTDVLNMLISDDGNTLTLSMRNYDYVEQDLQTVASARRLNTTLEYYLYMLPEGTTSQVSSLAYRNLKGSDIVTEDMNYATILSLALIVVIAGCACLSLKYGFSTLFPVCVGIMINYILMWSIGMNFDIVTIGFSSIAIGCGVDDAIHFMLRLKRRKNLYPNMPYSQLIYDNIIETGRPIILTTLSVDAGLLMLLFASFKPIKYFGILMCVALTAAMIATLTILPPILLMVEKAFSKIKAILKK